MNVIEPVLFELPELPPPPADFWLVMAVNVQRVPYWKVWRDWWLTQERAEAAAKKLSSIWRCKRLLHVKMP